MSYIHGADAAFAPISPPASTPRSATTAAPRHTTSGPAPTGSGSPGRRSPSGSAATPALDEGTQAVAALHALNVPKGAVTVLDMETRVDKTYVHAFAGPVQDAGYKIWVYGSASTVFGNPQLNGYWVADYTGVPHMHPQVGTRATQYAADLPPGFDASLIKAWTAGFMWGGGLK